jgi:hypothetical protein
LRFPPVWQGRTGCAQWTASFAARTSSITRICWKLSDEKERERILKLLEEERQKQKDAGGTA